MVDILSFDLNPNLWCFKPSVYNWQFTRHEEENFESWEAYPGISDWKIGIKQWLDWKSDILHWSLHLCLIV